MTHPALQFLSTFALLVVGALLCCVAISGKRTPPPLLVLLAFGLLCGGCATNSIDYDQFPDQAHCSRARDEAIGWYWHRYGKAPVCPPCIVTHEAKPRGGMAGWTTKSGIHIWVGQLRDETHEWRHWLCIWSLDDMSEEAVR